MCAQNDSYALGLKLKLPQYEVDAIHSGHMRPRDRLLHVIIEFLKQAEPRPTWRVILEALRSPMVNQSALARRIESDYPPEPIATASVSTGS